MLFAARLLSSDSRHKSIHRALPEFHADSTRHRLHQHHPECCRQYPAGSPENNQSNAVLYNEPILVTGRVGTHGVVQRFQSPCWTSDNTLVIKSEFYEYAFQALQRVDYVNMNRGSTQPLITQTDLKNVSIVIPTEAILLEYEKIAGTLMAMYESNRKENERLAVLRDTLLPRLMNGEIDVSNIEI